MGDLDWGFLWRTGFDVAQTLGILVVAVYGWIKLRTGANADRIAALEKKERVLSERIALTESDIRYLPSAEDVADLNTKIHTLEATANEMNATLKIIQSYLMRKTPHE